MNARNFGVSLTEYTCRTDTCIWLSSECAEALATESHKKDTCTQELWVRPGYNTQARCTLAGPTHAAGRGDGM